MVPTTSLDSEEVQARDKGTFPVAQEQKQEHRMVSALHCVLRQKDDRIIAFPSSQP